MHHLPQMDIYSQPNIKLLFLCNYGFMFNVTYFNFRYEPHPFPLAHNNSTKVYLS